MMAWTWYNLNLRMPKNAKTDPVQKIKDHAIKDENSPYTPFSGLNELLIFFVTLRHSAPSLSTIAVVIVLRARAGSVILLQPGSELNPVPPAGLLHREQESYRYTSQPAVGHGPQ